MLRSRHALGALLLLSAMLAAPLAAQPAAYRRTPGDTVRLREATTAEMTLRTPGGDLPATLRHDAVVAVAFTAGDTARAWYEALAVEASGAAGLQRPATDAVLRRPFTLAMDARGRVRTLAAPEIPAAVRGITDLSHQFDDFFLRLPAAPLRVGLAWSDTVVHRDSSAARYTHATRAAHYRVERDTVVGGRRALVVSMRQAVRLEAGGPVEGQPIRTDAVLAGGDSGIVVFAPAEGRLLGRARSGEMRGTLTVRGGAEPLAIPQTYRYRSTIAPVER